ncbi:hypothetical protein Glove_185g63 [Diversispora epigaea]|uniref:Protein kinase domain-containing protein n=1 Tax=Diversispora epigaea TaxID=1348612 RepID=A0A397IMB1_9GLOM|nr:hypothetical protein Glove_185g63 [Diversispora epigaea]
MSTIQKILNSIFKRDISYNNNNNNNNNKTENRNSPNSRAIEDNNISNNKHRKHLPKEPSSYPSSLEKYYNVSKKVLGRGSFAEVKECTDKRTGINYALKIILKKAIKGKEQMLTTELDVLKQVNHPNIVSLHDIYETKDAFYIITDLALGGELYNQLLQRGSYTEKDAANLIEQILLGVKYLHDRDIAHRDLKPENLLFSDKSEFSTLKITDFGLSKILKHHDDILMTACGTPGYVAPEVLTQNGYGKSVDIWSIGVILYTVLCGYTPFWGENQKALFDSILKGVYHFDNDYWSEISDEAKDLINKMLEYNPDKRITAHDALQHPWFKYEADELKNELNNEFNWKPYNNNNNNNNNNYNNNKSALKKAINVIQGVTRMRKLNDKQSRPQPPQPPQQQYYKGITNNYDKVNRINVVNIVNLVNSFQGEIGIITESEFNDDNNRNNNHQLQALGSSELFGLVENEIIDQYTYTKDLNDKKKETNKISINTNSMWSSEGSESDSSSICSISTTSLSISIIPRIPDHK